MITVIEKLKIKKREQSVEAKNINISPVKKLRSCIEVAKSSMSHDGEKDERDVDEIGSLMPKRKKTLRSSEEMVLFVNHVSFALILL